MAIFTLSERLFPDQLGASQGWRVFCRKAMRAANKAGVPNILKRIAKKAVSIICSISVEVLSEYLEIVGKNRES
jgi:hypothetical protein